jgi:CubicO group peptidase (beta-lactamase class C family)
MRRLLTGLACALVRARTATKLTSEQQPVYTPFGIITVLDAYLESLRQQAGIPGMSAAIVRDGVILWEKGYGFQNVQTRARATPATPYLIGDASGTLAAILLLQCVEQRRLDLDTPLGQYGIDIPERTATLRDLLSHRQADAETDFQYSPQRYAQLTTVAEWCIPQPYRKSVSHRIINRLAMIDSVPGTDLRDPNLPLPEDLYDPAELERYRRVLDRTAIGYKVEARGRADRTELAPVTMSASGGLVSTVRDLAKIDGALDARFLLLDETLAQAWAPTIGSRGASIPTGLGWFVQTYNNQRVVWHFGLVPNAYSSLILKVPERNLTFILLANSDKLVAPFQVTTGDVTRSLFSTLFLKLVT